MKKIALTLIFLGFSAMSFASIIQRDVMYDDGGSGAAHEWWVYLVAAPIALACYSLAGWLIHKAGRWGWLAAALMFAALGLVGKSFLLAFGLMFGVWIAWMVIAGNARKSQEVDDRIALEKVYREKHGADWREHWDRDHGMLRIREKSKQGQEIQSNRAMSRNQPPQG